MPQFLCVYQFFSVYVQKCSVINQKKRNKQDIRDAFSYKLKLWNGDIKHHRQLIYISQ